MCTCLYVYIEHIACANVLVHICSLLIHDYILVCIHINTCINTCACMYNVVFDKIWDSFSFFLINFVLDHACMRMRVCLCACLCVLVRVCVYIYTHTHTHIHIYTQMYAYAVWLNLHQLSHFFCVIITHIFTHAPTHIHIHSMTHFINSVFLFSSCVCVCIHTCKYMCLWVYIYIYTHTNM
jgi:hypothetical protein